MQWASAFIKLAVLCRRRFPRKILGHSIQLDSLPDSAVFMMMQRLLHTVKHRCTGILAEFETGTGSVLQIKRLDCIVKTACSANNRHRTVLQAVDLIQAAWLVARRHQTHIRAGFDGMSHFYVLRYF